MILELMFAASISTHILPVETDCITENQGDRSIELCVSGEVISVEFKDKGNTVFNLKNIDLSQLNEEESVTIIHFVMHAKGRWLLGFHPIRME